MRPLHLGVTAATMTLALHVSAARARAQQGTDAHQLEGKWAGMAGPPTDRVPIALEFKRNAKGELKGYWYAFVYEALEMPDTVVATPTGFAIKGWVSKFSFRGDSLEGEVFHSPFTVGRTETLPHAHTLPANIPAGPGPKWHTPLGSPIHAPVAIHDSVAYVGTTGGMFYALRVRDGAFVWAFAAGRPIFGGAVTTDSAVYFPCDDGFLYKLDRTSGKQLWRYDLGDGRVPRILAHQVVENSGDFDWDDNGPTPVIVDGVIYIGSGSGEMHAVDAMSGKKRWVFRGKGKIRGTAAVDSARVVFGTYDNFVYAVNRKNGKKIWERDTGASIVSGVSIIDGRVVLGNRGGLVVGLDATTGKTLWRLFLWGSSAEAEAVPADGSRFYLGSSDLQSVQYIDAADGRVIWRSDVFGWAWPRVAVSGERIFVSTVGGDPYEFHPRGAFAALDRGTGRIVWRWEMPRWEGAWMSGFLAAPVVAPWGLVVVGGLDGGVYGFPAT